MHWARDTDRTGLCQWPVLPFGDLSCLAQTEIRVPVGRPHGYGPDHPRESARWDVGCGPKAGKYQPKEWILDGGENRIARGEKQTWKPGPNTYGAGGRALDATERQRKPLVQRAGEHEVLGDLGGQGRRGDVVGGVSSRWRWEEQTATSIPAKEWVAWSGASPGRRAASAHSRSSLLEVTAKGAAGKRQSCQPHRGGAELPKMPSG